MRATWSCKQPGRGMRGCLLGLWCWHTAWEWEWSIHQSSLAEPWTQGAQILGHNSQRFAVWLANLAVQCQPKSQPQTHFAQCPPWRRKCSDTRFVANEDGVSRFEIGWKVRTRNILGVLGRRIIHDCPEEFLSGRNCGAVHVQRCQYKRKEFGWTENGHRSDGQARLLVESSWSDRTSNKGAGQKRTQMVNQEEWQHGWQYLSYSVTDSHFKKMTMLSGRTKCGSSSGGLSHMPWVHHPSTSVQNTDPVKDLFAIANDRGHCEGCHAQFDTLGRHWASCVRSGRKKKRAMPPERITCRIFREAGATFRQIWTLRSAQMTHGRFEKLVQDLPCYGGVQLAVDITLRRVLTCQRETHAHAADTNGAMLTKARADKEGSVLRVGQVKALQTDGHGHGNWRTVEWRVYRSAPGAVTRESSGNAVFQAILKWFHVGAQVDANARRHVCCSFRSFVGGASSSHFVVPHGRENPSFGWLLWVRPQTVLSVIHLDVSVSVRSSQSEVWTQSTLVALIPVGPQRCGLFLILWGPLTVWHGIDQNDEKKANPRVEVVVFIAPSVVFQTT